MAGPSRASLRFYAELNDHLAPAERYRSIEKEFFVPTTAKDLIESCGVPHAEVDLVAINGESSDFSRLVRDGDRVAVYPVFESLDITPELRVRERPLRELRFVLDVHLGRLARYLRMLGFDALYRKDAADPELARISADEQRILLTRDRGLLKHSAVTRGYWLREQESRRQLVEVVLRFDLTRSLRAFTRCMVCNTILSPAATDTELGKCPGCGRLYWQGTHYDRMRQWIAELAATAAAGTPSADRSTHAPRFPADPRG